MGQPTALIIGAGPAGLTAAHELLRRTDIRPIVLEMSDSMGGLSRTVAYKGNRIDISGHRFFSKSDRIMQWWRRRMPIEAPDGPDPDLVDSVMLLRSRRSRIFFGRKLFDYPISVNLDTLRKLGLWRVLKIGASYARATLRPIRPNPRMPAVKDVGRRSFSADGSSIQRPVFAASVSGKSMRNPARTSARVWAATSSTQ